MRRRHSDRCRRASVGLVTALVAALAACAERERIGTGPDDGGGGGGGGGGGPGTGPETVIEAPAADTTVPAGPGVFVAGVVSDPDGVDSVYFDIQGGITQVPPFKHNGTMTVNFAIPITTNGLAGETIIVGVFGVDLAGNRGEPAQRTIVVE